MKNKVSIFWFRRDLRLEDNTALYRALESGKPVIPIFIFDQEILQGLDRTDARVSFIHQCLEQIAETLKTRYGSSLAVYFGQPVTVFKQLIQDYAVEAVFTNRDYEPYALERDAAISKLLAEKAVDFNTYKDQVIFETDEVTKQDGNPYLVYTPYQKRWRQLFNPEEDLKTHNSEELGQHFIKNTELPWLSLSGIGFVPSEIRVPHFHLDEELVEHYAATRDFPAKQRGTSRLGPHLRFGTISIRNVAKQALKTEEDTFLKELIWREFFMQILWHFPHTVHKAFKPAYDRIKWRNKEEEFQAWKEGRTGYALVDAGMRELNTTGYMHNRVRMLVASFLCKHLLIDWRWGEAYFAAKLLDFELSSNVGNWQWAAGCGVDAAPYFRIFNPMTQAVKFDKMNQYIARWVPELDSSSYVAPIVDHKMARERCLRVFKEALDA